ncbi:MAG TPA: stage III sporulation protein AD [Clostridia bacterium]
MDIIKIIAIGLTSAVAYSLLKESKPEIAYLVLLAGSVIVFLMVVDMLVDIISTINGLAQKTGLDTGIIASVLKIIGIGYITEFSAGICEDMGAKSMSDKVLFGGKVIILFLSLPIITALIELIISILP